MTDYLALDLARCKEAYIDLDKMRWPSLDHQAEWLKFLAEELSTIIKNDYSFDHAQATFYSYADQFRRDVELLKSSRVLAERLA